MGSKRATSEEVAQYFADLAKNFQEKGYQVLKVFLDGNSTHKAKMQSIFKELTKALKIETYFYLIPPYSPKLNLVEYIIHLIRQKVLHHADAKKDLNYFETKIKDLCSSQEFLTKSMVVNILAHIETLIT